MGVPFVKIRDAAARIRSEAEYIASQDRSDIFQPAYDDLIAAAQIIMDLLMSEPGA